MITLDFITALFYEVDEQLGAISKHPEAHFWPSEVGPIPTLTLVAHSLQTPRTDLWTTRER